MLKVKVIGCGNAFSMLNGNQSFLITGVDNGVEKNMLVDCGSRIPVSLYQQNIDLKTIDAIYISHAHGDHVGGLEELALSRYDWTNRSRHYSEGNYAPKLIANKNLMKQLWDNTLSGGLSTMEGFDATLETFFETMPIEPNVKFMWCGWTFSLVQQVHIMTGSIIKNTFGLFIEKEGFDSIFITTDCQFFQPRQVMKFYEKADYVIQDCECIGVDTVNKEMKFASGVHANFAELAGWDSANAAKLSDHIKSKLLLSHYQDFVSNDKDMYGNNCNWKELAETAGFKGFVYVGQIIELKQK